jgi:ubiquinone biosynthesis protein UbiJ
LKPTADALNHLLRQNSWAGERLRAFAGKTARLSVPPFSSDLLITPAGEFSAAPKQTPVDAEITLRPSAALRAAFDPASAQSAAEIRGDAELATAVGKVLRDLRWDAEADLSRVIGDIPAHEIVRGGARVKTEITRKASALTGMLSEFWLEEQPQIAKKRHLEQFFQATNTLRDDVARLEKRLEQLERKT